MSSACCSKESTAMYVPVRPTPVLQHATGTDSVTVRPALWTVHSVLHRINPPCTHLTHPLHPYLFSVLPSLSVSVCLSLLCRSPPPPPHPLRIYLFQFFLSILSLSLSLSLSVSLFLCLSVSLSLSEFISQSFLSIPPPLSLPLPLSCILYTRIYL